MHTTSDHRDDLRQEARGLLPLVEELIVELDELKSSVSRPLACALALRKRLDDQDWDILCDQLTQAASPIQASPAPTQQIGLAEKQAGSSMAATAAKATR
jgi:hypothetical protein